MFIIGQPFFETILPKRFAEINTLHDQHLIECFHHREAAKLFKTCYCHRLMRGPKCISTQLSNWHERAFPAKFREHPIYLLIPETFNTVY